MTPACELCGEPMPAGEEMFKFHGYSGPCPKPPLSAPRPEGMSDESDWRHWPAESQLARIADGAMPGHDDEIGGCITRQQARTLVGELSRLRADGATLKVRTDEAHAAHSASFGALQTLSAALFDGEVDDYAALAEKVIARVRQLESDGATLREELASVTNTLREIRAQQKEDFKRADIAEAEAATLRERVKKLPNPIQLRGELVDDVPTGRKFYVCDWCDSRWSTRTPHPANGCLWPEVHKEIPNA